MFYQRTLIVYSQAVCRIQKIKKTSGSFLKASKLNEKTVFPGREYNSKGFSLYSGFEGKMEIVVTKTP